MSNMHSQFPLSGGAGLFDYIRLGAIGEGENVSAFLGQQVKGVKGGLHMADKLQLRFREKTPQISPRGLCGLTLGQAIGISYSVGATPLQTIHTCVQ